MNEFLNPKSMVTPGVAGATVMFVSNSICSQFPEIAFRWSAVGLSFLVGTVVFSSTELKFAHRLVFWVVNSLIIFSVGIGTSNIAANVQQRQANAQKVDSAWILNVFGSTANAEESPSKIPLASSVTDISTQLDEIKGLLAQQIELIKNLQAENLQLKAGLEILQDRTTIAPLNPPTGSSDLKRLEDERQRAEAAQRRAADEAQRARLEAERAAAESARLNQIRETKNFENSEGGPTPSSSFFNRW